MDTQPINKCFNTYFFERFHRLFCGLFFSQINQRDQFNIQFILSCVVVPYTQKQI